MIADAKNAESEMLRNQEEAEAAATDVNPDNEPGVATRNPKSTTDALRGCPPYNHPTRVPTSGDNRIASLTESQP